MKKFIIPILLYYIYCSSILETTKISIDNEIYTKTNVELIIDKVDDNIYVMEDLYLLSDLVNFLPKKAEFTLQIIQGTISKTMKSQFYPFGFDVDNLISDYPNGYIYYSKNFSPLDNVESFKKYFDVFSLTFKITLNPLFDRSSYITINDNKILIENKEKACNIHLDGIKETLHPSKWKQFTDEVDYTKFARSDYKSIKYHIINNDKNITYKFEIISRDEKEDNIYDDKIANIEKFNIDKYIISNRYIEGIHYNIDNFIFHHKIQFINEEILEKVKNKKLNFEMIENLPTNNLLPRYSTLKIILYNKGNIVKILNSEESLYYFSVTLNEKKEEKFPSIPFTFESKVSTQMNIKYKAKSNIGKFDALEFTMEFAKTMMNFESFDNKMEFGYIFPCGLIVLNNSYTITNYAFYNMPNIDITMPFNIISLCWFAYGFMIVQILNIFLGKSGSKGLLETLKDRFVAKWGILWGRTE